MPPKTYTRSQVERADVRTSRIQKMMDRYGVSYKEAAQVIDELDSEKIKMKQGQNLAGFIRYLHVVSGQMAHRQMQRDASERRVFISKKLYMSNYNHYKEVFFQEICKTHNIPSNLRK